MLDRRGFLIGLALSGLAAPQIGWALSGTEAERLINSVVNDINAAIDSGRSEAAILQEFERIFARYSDTAYIAAYTMGVDGRRASAAQKRAYSGAFQSYLSSKYGRQFREFSGGRLTVEGVRQVKSWFEVDTIAYLPGEAPFAVTFQVSNRTGRNLFFNMYVEGVNLLLNERNEIGSLLDKNRGDIDAMIRELEQRS